MKAKFYFFRLTVAIVTLALGVGVYFVWQSFSVQSVSAIPTMTNPVVEIAKPADVIEPANEKTELPVKNGVIQEVFYPDGDYQLIGDLPKDFEDIDFIAILVNEPIENNDGTYYLKPIKPAGVVLTKVRYGFTQTNIKDRQISFETKKVKGISYSFTGYFPVGNSPINEPDTLKGHLIKLKNGKKIAEINAEFERVNGEGGC